MGMFKDIRDLHKASKQYPRPTMREGLRQANEMVQEVEGSHQLAQDLAERGVSGQVTVNALRATGAQVNYMPEMEMDLTVERRRLRERGYASPGDLARPDRTAGARRHPACEVDPQDHSRLLVGTG